MPSSSSSNHLQDDLSDSMWQPTGQSSLMVDGCVYFILNWIQGSSLHYIAVVLYTARMTTTKIDPVCSNTIIMSLFG